ncbi:hypothetical protein ACE5IS_19780 [Leptospira wolffii]|uniref:DUF4145 domain-containing protein n=1 Tax=Leptospira wolffii TaxID=409998 RepID=A0ABV5BTX6_9LEPT
MNPYEYAREKFDNAIYALISDGDLKVRLKQAYAQIWEFKGSDVPEDARQSLDSLHQTMTEVRENEGHYIDDTIKRMDTSQAIETAQQIFEIYKIVLNKYFLENNK